jgi:protein-disulfide isomerase
MGNPDAPVKLIEYASYTCPACKAFTETGSKPLVDTYVKSGRVSWEFRSLLIHAPDAPITLMLQCRAPDVHFALAEQVYGAFEDIVGKLSALTPADQQTLQTLQPADQFKLLSDRTGLFGFFGARGLPRAQAEACLSDKAKLDALTAHQERASELGVSSTPSFIINGELQSGATTWPQLQPLLQQAVGG